MDRRTSLTEASGATSGGVRPGSAGRIGDILLSEGKITREQLELALTMQRNDPRKLGEILLSLGFVTAQDLAQALAKHLKLEYVVISELPPGAVQEEALGLLDEKTMRKYTVLPLREEDGRLVVAMSDPNDLFALEDLRMLTRRPIRPVVATVEDLEGAFAHLFGETEETPPPDDSEPVGPDTGIPVEDEEDEQFADEEFADEEIAGEEVAGAESADEAFSGGGAVEADAVVEAAGEEVAGEEAVAERENGAASAAARAAASRAESVRRGRTGPVGGRIGDILVAEGKITQEQLEEALACQHEDRRELGQILLSMGYIDKVDLAKALATRLRLEYVEFTDKDVDRSAASLVDQKVSRRHAALPLRVQDGRLVVAMSDPTDFYALEDLRMISGYPVTPVVAVDEEIARVQNRVFAVSQDVTEILEEAAGGSGLDDIGEVELGDGSADNAPVVRLVSSILQQAVGEGASDIHIEPRARQLTVRLRVDGVLREVMSVPSRLQNGVIARLKILSNLNIAERRVPQDGRFSVKLGDQKVDLRVATLPTVFGEKVVLRLLNTGNIDVDLTGLGFAPEALESYKNIFRRPYGTILVTGPTGSGKSTTLYATLGELNTPDKNIITVEDPVEFRMRGVNQIQVNTKVGLTFASGLRSILRSDPDVLMIGEIRDAETAKISVEAALTGHLVLATLHTNNAPAAVTRLTEMGVEPFLTSSAVDCVIAQRLARRLCERCKRPAEMGEEALAALNFPFERLPEGHLDFMEAVGCDRCGGTGYRGRVAIYEMMVLTDEIRDLVLKRVSTDEISRAAEEAGMVRLREDGLLKAAQGVTTIEEILRTVV
jgi:type IV pilus assembly protein PilB